MCTSLHRHNVRSRHNRSAPYIDRIPRASAGRRRRAAGGARLGPAPASRSGAAHSALPALLHIPRLLTVILVLLAAAGGGGRVRRRCGRGGPARKPVRALILGVRRQLSRRAWQRSETL